MKKIVDYFKGIMADSEGAPSSKRFVSLGFAVLIVIAFIGNLVWNWTIDDNLLDAAMMIVIFGLGITGVEKFAPKLKQMTGKDTVAK